MPDKGQLSKIYKEFLKFNVRKQEANEKNWSKTLTDAPS